MHLLLRLAILRADIKYRMGLTHQFHCDECGAPMDEEPAGRMWRWRCTACGWKAIATHAPNIMKWQHRKVCALRKLFWRPKVVIDRQPMIEVDWFQSSGHLAIADVVWVKGIGLCSHQPGPHVLFDGKHRMRDLSGNYHFVESHDLYMRTPEESEWYWQNAKWAKK